MQEEVLDRYRIVRRIGSGGFGSVYEMWDTRMRRTVAVKVLPLSPADAEYAGPFGGAEPWGAAGDAAGDAAAAAAGAGGGYSLLFDADGARWERSVPGLEEARAAANLHHENIVTIHDMQMTDRAAYIIMEYVEGITLARLLELYSDELTLDDIASLFRDTARALEAAHKGGVLHLDVKPANILVDTEGRCKVIDFGLAAMADAQGFGSATGGSIGYVPLEQIRGERLDARSDIWALASVTYELLVGRNPFKRPDFESAQEAILEEEFLPPSEYWDDLDVEADGVVARSLFAEPYGRYATVREFRERLAPLLGDPTEGREDLADMVNEALRPAPEGESEDTGLRPAASFGDVLALRASSTAGKAACVVGALVLLALAGLMMVRGVVPAAATFAVLALFWWVLLAAMRL